VTSFKRKRPRCWPKNQKPPVSFPLFRCEARLRQRAMIRHKPPCAIRYSMRLPHFLAGTEVDNFGCTWTLCSTQSGDGWPQRSQLQPGVPSLGRCVSLPPAMFCNLGLGDPLSSCNKRIVFISYSFLLGEPTAGAIARLHADWLFALRNLLRPKPTATNLNSSSPPSVRAWSFLCLIVDYHAPIAR
jgi:hypothetical protein